MEFAALVLIVSLVIGVSYLATALYLRWAIRAAILDHPGMRSLHQLATVTGGGSGMVAGVLSGCLLLAALGIKAPVELLLGALVLALVGAIDDRRSVPVQLRLLVQFFAAGAVLVVATLAATGNGTFAFISVAWLLGAVFVLMWLTNLYNFMDGIDGLAALQALLIAVAASVMLPADSLFAPLLIVVAAACAAFLIFNWPPARIFMGDTGSLFLGFLLGAIAIVSSRLDELEYTTWLILWAGFLGDATITLMLRLWRREVWYRPHRQHAYQRLALRWNSHRRVTVAALLLNLGWFWPLAGLAHHYPDRSLYALLLAYLPMLTVVCYLDRHGSESQAAKMPESTSVDTAIEQ